MSFLSETLRAFSFADLCTGLAGADLVAPPPEDTVVLDLRPRIGRLLAVRGELRVDDEEDDPAKLWPCF